MNASANVERGEQDGHENEEKEYAGKHDDDPVVGVEG